MASITWDNGKMEKKMAMGYGSTTKEIATMGLGKRARAKDMVFMLLMVYFIVTLERKYKGEFANFMKNGWGKEFFPNGDTFEGFYKDGFPHGSGIYNWNDGTSYEGVFNEGLRQGKGVLRT
jgi:hypothetical protein